MKHMWDSKIHLSIPRSRPNMSAFIKGRTSESAFCDPLPANLDPLLEKEVGTVFVITESNKR